MKIEHIEFSVLSDFHDDMLSPEKREAVLAHIRECAACKKEYEDLQTLVRMVSCLKGMGIKNGDEFTRHVICLIETRRTRSYFRKLVPSAAVAALIVFAVGLDYFGGRSQRTETATTMTSAPSVDLPRPSINGVRAIHEISSDYGIKKTLSILRSNSARVVMMSDSYIEGEAPARGFNNLCREFEAAQTHASYGMATPVSMREPEMAQENSVYIAEQFAASGARDGGIVRFRVNLR